MVTLPGSWPSLAEEYNDLVKTLERDNVCKLVYIHTMIIFKKILCQSRLISYQVVVKQIRHNIHSGTLASWPPCLIQSPIAWSPRCYGYLILARAKVQSVVVLLKEPL